MADTGEKGDTVSKGGLIVATGQIKTNKTTYIVDGDTFEPIDEGARAEIASLKEDTSAEITSLKEDLKWTSNTQLFDKTSITIGKRFDGAGGLIDDNNCFVSDFIPVVEGFSYYKKFANDHLHRIVYFIFPIESLWPQNNIFISSDNITTAPENACYARFSGLVSELDETTFIVNSSIDREANRVVKKIISRTSNLVDETKSVNGYITKTGEITQNDSYKTTDYIKILKGEKITIRPSLRKFVAFGYNKVALSDTFIDANTENYTFTASQDGYIRFTYNAVYNGVVQANKGDAILAYEPYGYKIKNDVLLKGVLNLTQKKVYSFGDSLIYGHYSGIGMLDGLTTNEGMIYTKYAVNGAAIMGGGIETQVVNANPTAPDFIVFDGLMNDTPIPEAYGAKLGELSASYTLSDFDTTTFYGAFEHLLCTIRNKYMQSNIIFVCCHKTPSRTAEAQETLQKACRECCEKWAIPYVDIYNGGQINCYIDSMRNAYSYNQAGETSGGNGTHLTGSGYDKWYAPEIRAKMIELLS